MLSGMIELRFKKMNKVCVFDFRKILFFLLLVNVFICSCLFSAVNSVGVEEHSELHKYKFSVCAFFKDEEKYIREWVEYHKLIGVEHFYLYDNGSRDFSRGILDPYVKEGLVTLIHWSDRMPFRLEEEAATHWALSTQIPAYEHATKWEAYKETEWLAFLEIDEFLVPVSGHSLGDVLKEYQDFPGINLSCDCYQPAPVDSFLRRKLLISTVELRDVPNQMMQISFDKAIIKPEMYTSFSWPPYKCHYKDHAAPAQMRRGDLKINKYVNRPKGSFHFEKRREKLHVDNRILADYELKKLLQLGYEIDDAEKAIFKYVPSLAGKLGLELGWER